MSLPSPAARRQQSAAADDGGAPGAAEGADGAGAAAGRPEATAEWDLLTDEVRWSPEVYGLFGREPGQGPLSLDRLPDRLAEADRPLLRRMMTDALVHGRCPAGLVRVAGRGPVECAGEPVLGADGTVTALRLRLRAA